MIVTVTMNPAIDKTVDIEHLERGGLNRITHVELDAGGKGINVSIVLNNLGLKNTALGFEAGFTGKEYVIDAYCGIGTIGMVASDHVDSVIGVELNKDAVRDAIGNAKGNQIKNIRFVGDDAGRFMVKLASAAERGEDVRLPDVVLMDPPRSGSDENFLSSLVKMGPEKVVYISCNPETQQRDLFYLIKNGYKVKKIQPVDMFPYTAHVETVVLMTK